jgi:hypothetical protein
LDRHHFRSDNDDLVDGDLMNDNAMNDMTFENEMTLDPPGRIAVVGAGPLGLEAALYGRFLGYDITVFERGDVGQSLRDCIDQPLPMLPSACLSPLAWSAINAQLGSGELALPETLPLTVGQWLRDGLQRLVKTDLLRGRIRTGHEVVGIELIEVATDDHASDDARADSDGADDVRADDGDAAMHQDDTYVEGDVPPDFRLIVNRTEAHENGDGRTDFEAVVWATGAADVKSIAGIDRCQDSPYFFTIGQSAITPAVNTDVSAALALRTGWKDIVRIFAALGGRAELDLYRPIRL